MKEFLQKEWYRISLDPLIQKRDAYGSIMVRLIVTMVVVTPNPPERLTTIGVRAGLDLQSKRRSYAS